jgi:thiol-disulfide isomerase/thioredoxin
VSNRLAPEARGRKREMKSGRALAGAAVLFHGHAFHRRDHRKLKPAALAAGVGCWLGLAISAAGLTNDSRAAPAEQPAAKTATLQVWSEGKKPSFVLDSLGGESKSLKDHQGRVVLVHFFATWCEPCREEIASLQRLVERASTRPLVLAVDVGEVDIRVQRFFEKAPVDFPVLLDRDKATTKSWGVDQLPTTFLLDATLTPRFLIVGDFDWDRADMDRLIAELSIPQERNGPRAGG